MRDIDTVYQLSFSPAEKKEIELCLNCPFPECTNCLRNEHEPGKRPERTMRTAAIMRQRIRELMLTTSLPQTRIASYVGCSVYLTRQVLDELKAEGLK